MREEKGWREREVEKSWEKREKTPKEKNKHIKLAGNDKLRIERELSDVHQRAQLVRDVLRSLGQPTVKETS